MKVTFKQFLEDIHVDDVVYGKDQSDNMTEKPELHRAAWKELPLKHKFPTSGFTIKYSDQGKARWANSKAFHIALFHDQTQDIAVHIDCSSREYTVPGGTIIGLETELLSSAAKYRGKGLVVQFYECLAANGQNIFSAPLQTSGGASVWKRLVASTDQNVFAMIPTYDLEDLGYKAPRGVKLDDYDFVLAHGDVNKLIHMVYKSGDAFWFITSAHGNFMKYAVKV